MDQKSDELIKKFLRFLSGRLSWTTDGQPTVSRFSSLSGCLRDFEGVPPRRVLRPGPFFV
jgi:hypothetical protein